MTQPDFTAAQEFAIHQLMHHLPQAITYHSPAHTLDEVLPAVERMIQSEGVMDATDRLLLRTAALYHDLGYTSAHSQHEVVSASIAESRLPEFGYSNQQVETVQAMIMATRLPQSPQGLLQEILADADLDLLGSPDFFARNVDLRNEMEAVLQPFSDDEWYAQQVKFLQEHRYFTPSTQAFRGPGKQNNLEALIQLKQQAQSLDSARAGGNQPHSG